MNTYNNNEIIVKDIIFKISLNRTEENREIFNIEITNKINGNTIKINDFGNSIMDYNLSLEIKDFILNKNKYNNSYDWFLKNSKAIKGWGGYSDCKNLKELNEKRIKYLQYGVVVDFSVYIDFLEENPVFEEFCSNYGYEEDSRKAEDTYKKCLAYYSKIYKLRLTKEQKDYFQNVVRTEKEEFSKLIGLD